jgi:hypothetical protein
MSPSPRIRAASAPTGEVRLDDGKFGNFRRSAWRRLVPSPSTARGNGADLLETRERGKSASNLEGIWGIIGSIGERE